MKVTSVELHPDNSSAVHVLSYKDPRMLNPYNIIEISGLDAETIIPRYYGSSESSEAKFYNLSVDEREVTFRIGLNPNFTTNQSYSDLRDNLYRVIASSRTGLLQVQFKNGTDVVAAFSGFVTKLQSPHFEKVPEVQLTVKPNDPASAFLRALDPVDVDVTDLDPALTNLNDPYSTAPHGFEFIIEVMNPLILFHMSDPFDPSWSFKVGFGWTFLPGDLIKLSSYPQNKQLIVNRSGANIYMADGIFADSLWPIMFPGDNKFTFEDAGYLNWVSISYYPTYWGV